MYHQYIPVIFPLCAQAMDHLIGNLLRLIVVAGQRAVCQGPINQRRGRWERHQATVNLALRRTGYAYSFASASARRFLSRRLSTASRTGFIAECPPASSAAQACGVSGLANAKASAQACCMRSSAALSAS
jgi:hypothetical protein